MKRLTAETLLQLKETKQRLEEYGDEYLIRNKIKKDLAKSKNYKDRIFFHASGGIGENGVGVGLYLGKDKNAIDNFYNSDGTFGEIEKYIGAPRFIDLVNYEDFDEFEKIAKQNYPNEENNNHFKKLVLKKGFDGIRYYDPIATGEEFVLFNINKVKQI